MDGQDTYRYQSGRGLPTYLLPRNYADSSTDSNGASRIFAASGSSMTSDEDRECSFISHIPRTFSYTNTSSNFAWSDTISISMAPNTFQYETSSASRSIDDETRIIRSEMFSTRIEDPPNFSATSSIGEASSTTAETRVSSVVLLSGLVIDSMSLLLLRSAGPWWDIGQRASANVSDLVPGVFFLPI